MKKLGVGFAALACLSGCGSDSDGGGTTQASVVVDLRVDVNRDGQISFDDPADDDGEDVWTPQAGAVFLPNIDDDAQACPKGGAISGITDDQLAQCRDSANEVVDGPEDEQDLARLAVRPWPQAPKSAIGRVWVDSAAVDQVRLFRRTPNGFQVVPVEQLDDGTSSWRAWLSAEELATGMELAIEGRDFVRSTTGWNGLVDVHLDVDTGEAGQGIVSDVVQMRVAPLMLSHQLQPAEQVFATRVSWLDNQAFHAEYDAAVNKAAVAGGIVDNSQNDHWTQDWMEIGYTTVPAPGGEQRRMDVFMRSTNVYRPGQPANALRDAGREVYASYHGSNSAAYTPPFEIGHPQQMDSLNSYGNTETIPPHSHAGKSYPLGRILRGRIDAFYTDPLTDDFFKAQRVQPPVFIDTSWLLVGHVDETLSFLKTDNDLGFIVLANDAALAKKMLEDLVAAGQGDTPMFAGKQWIDFDTNKNVPAQATVSEVLADTEVMAESKKAEVEVAAQLDAIRTEVGIQDTEIVPAPFLHMSSYGVSVAYQPGTVNGQVLSDKVFASPRPHGPKVNGVDPFEKQLEDALAPYGIEVVWVEDWDMLHRLSGEVHCGTNTKRAPLPGVFWWEVTP
ncbi:MAG: protein-arginine deiminase family protein [Polyangiaceae bacterium]